MSETYEPIPNELRSDPTWKPSSALDAEVAELITHYPEGKQRSAALMVLHAIQEAHGWIPQEAVEWAAGKLALSPINIYELVTFYPMLRREPFGKYHLKVCRTLSCALGGSGRLHDHLCQRLSLNCHSHGPQTTKDGKYTVEFVECLASCGTAPVMMCNEDFFEDVSAEKADALLQKYR